MAGWQRIGCLNAAKASASNALLTLRSSILTVMVEMDRRFATAPTHRLPAAAATALPLSPHIIISSSSISSSSVMTSISTTARLDSDTLRRF